MKLETAITENEPTKPLIFIIEDEVDIASLISLTLENAGFTTRIFYDGKSIVQATLKQLPALILLDGMLPDMDGLDILRSLENPEQFRRIRKIMLSARNSEADKVRALELGADDYVSKPFSPRELVARVRAVLRSEHAAEKHRTIQLGTLIADLDARRVTLEGAEIFCTTTEFKLLVYFMQYPGRTLSRDRLLANIWGANRETVDTRVIDVYVRRLREKIEPDSANPSRLVTRRGDGYALLDTVQHNSTAE